ncbi:MAG: hypothetical protein E7Z96_09265 [Actinomycetaceae bacterium]|nr:hypothetical protein [Actinomycetaceae bacterium]
MDELYVDPDALTKSAGRAHDAADNAARVKVSHGLGNVGKAMPGGAAEGSAASAGSAIDKSAQRLTEELNEYADAIADTRDSYVVADEQVHAGITDLLKGSVLNKLSSGGDGPSILSDSENYVRNLDPAEPDSQSYTRNLAPAGADSLNVQNVSAGAQDSGIYASTGAGAQDSGIYASTGAGAQDSGILASTGANGAHNVVFDGQEPQSYARSLPHIPDGTDHTVSDLRYVDDGSQHTFPADNES